MSWSKQVPFYKFALCLLLGSQADAQTQPVISGLNPATVSVGDPGFTLTVSGSNFVAGARVLWNGASLTTTFLGANQLSATVPGGLLTAPGSVFVYVTNPDGRSSAPSTFTIGQGALTITTATLPGGTVGTAYNTTVQVSGGSAPYLWFADGLPPGLAINAAGIISGTPTTSGNFNVTVRVTDRVQLGVNRIFPLTITPAQLSITNATVLPPGTVSVPYNIVLTGTGGIPPYRWSSVGVLPEGITLNAATGTLSGVPQRRGDFSFNIQLNDNSGASTTRSFTLAVQPPPLTITTEAPLFNGTVGVFYTQNFLAFGGTPPYRWSLSGSLPSGLTFDGGAGTLNGTPTVTGTFSFTIQVADSSSVTATKSFSMTVELPRLTIVTTTPLPSGTVGTNYTQRLSATGGSLPYTWSVTSGGVPGLVFDSSGQLTGTPTTSGTHSITIQVRDNTGATTSSRTFAITINPSALLITSSTQLPAGTTGAAYSFTLAAIGGVPPYTWSANGLPDGLELDSNTGEISGTPNAGGPIAFTVRLTDSTRLSVTDLFRINLSLPTLPEVSLSGLPETAEPVGQPRVQIGISSAYPTAISGRLTLSFTPETGGGDATIQFSTGGRGVDFTIPAGSTVAVFPSQPLAIQTGTVAGMITLTTSLHVGGVDVTPSPVPSRSIRVNRAAPVITSAKLTRSGAGLSVVITGYTTSREITQAVFRFRAASGSTLPQSDVNVPVEELFTRWYQDTNSTRFGSQFLFTQPFTVQGGDASVVTPVEVTLTNRIGSTTVPIE